MKLYIKLIKSLLYTVGDVVEQKCKVNNITLIVKTVKNGRRSIVHHVS